MHPTARVDLTDLFSLLEWLFSQWWVWAVLGVIALAIIILILLPASKVKASESFSTTDAEANELALGFLQISNLPSGLWNDPTAGLLTDREKKHLVEQWGVPTRESWLAAIDRLLTNRRRREVWTLYLAVRAELGDGQQRTPKAKEWLQTIVAQGGDKRDARTFITAVEYSEGKLRKLVGKDIVTPDVFVRTLDGYALGQAVALATWGVALGHADVPEARRIIQRINAEGRSSFGSWADFGLSYIVGRIMHWSDGKVDEKKFEKFGTGWADFKAACTEKRRGPWATLSWRL